MAIRGGTCNNPLLCVRARALRGVLCQLPVQCRGGGGEGGGEVVAHGGLNNIDTWPVGRGTCGWIRAVGLNAWRSITLALLDPRGYGSPEVHRMNSLYLY